VAIKVMQGRLASDQDFRRRFQREVQVSRDLTHPHIVRVDDWGEQDGILYLVLEFIDGQTMDGKIPDQGWTFEEALPYLQMTVEALIYAHGRGVVHRDLKPENIMIPQGGGLKVMDFGLARSNDVSKVTKTGSALGTPGYMPPEQITGAPPRPVSDQYAFGIMMYEMLTGRRPFDDPDPMSVLYKHMSEPPPSLRAGNPSISESLEVLVMRMLEKEPNQRLASFEVVRDALEEIASGRPWSPPPLPQGPPRRVQPAPPAQSEAVVPDDARPDPPPGPPPA
jgi:serine/threonine-protein kinase